MKIVILGGDGFCGWPTALHLSAAGHDITIVDDQSRRRIDEEMNCESLTPIADTLTRMRAWERVSGRAINYEWIDICLEYEQLLEVLQGCDAVVHFAEQRSAPYSMRDISKKRYTVSRNINATNNVLCAITESNPRPHLVHLGTMGVYGYGTAGAPIPEGYLDVPGLGSVVYPPNPGSVYHTTKVMDAQLFAFYAKNDRLRITDLHQGIVWGTSTLQTELDPELINRFDYDGDYGTVLNRFLMQTAVGFPLTVYGTGGQTRAFIHIQDTVRCIELALLNPPREGERVKIMNQMTETHRVRDLAELVCRLTGCTINPLRNPRNEAAENELSVSNDCFLNLGLKPTLLQDTLMMEVTNIARRYVHRCNYDRIKPTAQWV